MVELNKLGKTSRRRIRRGRGISAGKGKTAGRGSKGQKSRSGSTIPVGFEGGQTPLKQRLPKLRGFFRHHNIPHSVITLDKINKAFKSGEKVNRGTLKEKGLIRTKKVRFKIMSGKSFKSKLTFEFVPMSKMAQAKATEAGSKIIQSKKK
jgi:large subunit ribosomal protein L15